MENQLIYVMKAVEAASDAIGISDAMGRHFYQNKAFSDLYGYATAEELELAGGGPATVKDPEVAEEMFDNIMHGKSWAGELEVVTKSGRVFTAFERADAIKNNEGKIIGLIGIITDVTERKKTEEALLYYQIAVDSSTDAIGMSTPEGRHYYQNEAYTRMFGLSVSEVDGVSGPPSTVYADEKEGAKIFDIIMKGGSFTGEVKMLDKDRNEMDIDLRAYSIKSKEGKVIGLVGIHTDITTRKRADGKLRKSEQHLMESQRVAHLGSWDLNLVSQELEWSDQTYRLFDKSPKDFVPSFNEFARLVHPDDHATMENAFLKALESDTNPYHVAVRIINDSGREWVMEASGVVRRDASGKALSIFGTGQDITERKKAEEALRESESLLRESQIIAGLGSYIMDIPAGLCKTSDVLDKLLGIDEAYERSVDGWLALVHPDDRAMIVDYLKEVIGRRGTFDKEYRIIRHDDRTERWVHGSGKLELDGQGRPLKLHGTIQDITDRKKMEEQLLQTQKLEAIGTLAGGIAHDFNNLLQGVFGYISIAKLNTANNDRSITALEQAEKALHMSVNLTTQLLTFSKGGKPVKKNISLQTVIENSVRFALSGSSADYRIKLDPDLWHVEADEGQIGQVIQNVVLNADQSMPMGGTIVIAAKNVQSSEKGSPELPEEGKYVEITVQDAGNGISEEYLPKIFDPYFTTKAKGSGLGLATCYSIIKNHGGVIHVSSIVGRGTTFYVYLPAIEAGKEAPKAPDLSPIVRKGKVLLMDDDELIRNITGAMIEALDHEVDFAEHGEEAIEKYKASIESGKPFDIVILDLTIRGGMGGRETIERLLALNSKIKAVVSSGYSDDAVVYDYLNYGFTARLTKPYKLEELRVTLNNLLSR